MLRTTKILTTTGKAIVLVSLFLAACCSATAQYKAPSFCETTPSWDKITVSSDPLPAGTVKMFVISNRPYIAGAENDEIFPNDIADFRKVSYFIVSCDGSEWQIKFVNDFNEGMRHINDGRDMLLFIEGHGKSLPMALNRAFQVQERYNVALLVFDWPSKNSNFNKSLSRVRRCGDNFYNLMLAVRDYRREFMSKNQHFSIMAHSLGNYFLSNLVVCGDAQYLIDPFIDNIVLNAAAIRTREHGEVLSRIMFADRLYITSNKNDFVLRGAHLLTSGRMLGNEVIKPLADNSDYVSFTEVAGKEHSYYYGYHSFEYDNPAFFYFYNTAIHGMEVNLDDTSFFKPGPAGDGYEVKTSGKPSGSHSAKARAVVPGESGRETSKIP